MKERQTLLQRIWNWARRQWRLVWLVALFACAFSALLWGLPLLVNQTLQGSFDDTKSDLQALDPLQFLPKAVKTTASATPTPSPTPQPTAKAPCIYPTGLTADQQKAIDVAIKQFTALLGVNVDLPGYECTIVAGVKPPRSTATVSATPTPTPTQTAAPTKTPKPTKTRRNATASPTPSPTPTANEATAQPTAKERELYWLIDWKPVDYSSRITDLLGGDQLIAYSVQVRQSDGLVLQMETRITGAQVPQVTLINKDRLTASYNLINRMELGFAPYDAQVKSTYTKTDKSGNKVPVSSTMKVFVRPSAQSDSNENSRIIEVVIDEMSGKVIGFQLDDSWY